MIHGTIRVLQETLLNDYLLEKDHLQTLFEHPKNLASSSRGLRREFTEHTMTPEMGMRREPQSSAVPELLLHSGGGFPHHTGGTYSHSVMMDYTRFPVSEMH